MELKAEAKQLKVMEQSMDEMTTLSGNREQYYKSQMGRTSNHVGTETDFFLFFWEPTENIQKKLVGLEDAIEKLEMDAEVMSLADWKKSKVSELDKYMDGKR